MTALATSALSAGHFQAPFRSAQPTGQNRAAAVRRTTARTRNGAAALARVRAAHISWIALLGLRAADSHSVGAPILVSVAQAVFPDATEAEMHRAVTDLAARGFARLDDGETSAWRAAATAYGSNVSEREVMAPPVSPWLYRASLAA